MIRSTNRSVSLVINMIHSVVLFYPTNGADLYPFILFHDENFTSSMEQQIRSCVSKHKKKVQIFFALVNLRTTVLPSSGSRLEKPIGYRLMCRFWTYDVFYHPAIIQGNYDYLMRMDDDSYFSQTLTEDLFQYMRRRRLDYLYRSAYSESFAAMHPILKRFLRKPVLHHGCIYNNFFIIRLKWFYESQHVQSFVGELIKDDLMLREYIGDGCIHGAMLEIDQNVKVERLVTFSYGHNFHVVPMGWVRVLFYYRERFLAEINKSCGQLTILQGQQGLLIRIKIRTDPLS